MKAAIIHLLTIICIAVGIGVYADGGAYKGKESMKLVIILFAVFYTAVGMGVFAMHTQMPATFWLAVLRSVLWPVWMAGGLRGTPLPMD